MTEPVSTLKVYSADGKTQPKTITFKGNFGFKLDGKEYKASNGHVYDSNGKTVQGLKMPAKLASQFIGMSNTAELAQDYTFSAKDIKEAETYFSNDSNNSRINSILGTSVTDGFSNGYAKYDNGTYSTHYQHNVSVWQIKE